MPNIPETPITKHQYMCTDCMWHPLGALSASLTLPGSPLVSLRAGLGALLEPLSRPCELLWSSLVSILRYYWVIVAAL